MLDAPFIFIGDHNEIFEDKIIGDLVCKDICEQMDQVCYMYEPGQRQGRRNEFGLHKGIKVLSQWQMPGVADHNFVVYKIAANYRMGGLVRKKCVKLKEKVIQEGEFEKIFDEDRFSAFLQNYEVDAAWKTLSPTRLRTFSGTMRRTCREGGKKPPSSPTKNRRGFVAP